MSYASFAEELRKWWSFDDRQMHTHSWHSREDFIAGKMRELIDVETKPLHMEIELWKSRFEAERQAHNDRNPDGLVSYAQSLEARIDAVIRILSNDKLPLQSRVSDARSILARWVATMSLSSAVLELRRFHSDLAAELDRHRAENPNDERGIAIMAARKNGVGRAIEIVERHSKLEAA